MRNKMKEILINNKRTTHKIEDLLYFEDNLNVLDDLCSLIAERLEKIIELADKEYEEVVHITYNQMLDNLIKEIKGE